MTKQEAIKVLQVLRNAIERGEWIHSNDNEALDMAIEALTAQPERKKGKWKRRIVDSGYNADWICSECGYRVKTDFVNYNFCPNCGADMRGEQE